MADICLKFTVPVQEIEVEEWQTVCSAGELNSRKIDCICEVFLCFSAYLSNETNHVFANPFCDRSPELYLLSYSNDSV